MKLLENKKGQVSVEMIAIVGFLILGAVILAALFFSFSRSQTEVATDLDTGFSSTLENYLTDIGSGVEGGGVDDADVVQLYNLTLLTNPDGVGIVTGAGAYQLGDLVNIEATLPAGYVFSGWSTSSGQVLSLNLNHSFYMPATNLILYANYSLDSYNLSVSKIGTGSGLVTSNPNGINCGSFCTSNYVHGTSVTLTATPFLNNTFIGWNGEGCSGTGSCTVTMDQTRSVTANFSTENCNLLLIRNPPAGGSVSGDGTYQCGSSRTVTANPNVGYDFVNWTNSSGNVVSNSPSYTFNLNNNTTLRANFVVRNCTLSVQNNPSVGGFVSPTGNLIQQCGTSVTLTANPSDGYNFGRWGTLSGGVLSSNNPYTFILSNNLNIVANYNLDSYDLILLKDPASGGDVFGAGPYNYNDNVTINASSNIGYNFLNWSNLSGDVLSNNPEHTFNMPLNNLTLIANYEINNCILSLTRNPSAGGSVSGDGTYQCGSSRTITATPNVGYEFVNWTNSSGHVVSNSPSYTFNLNNEVTLQANFVVKNCTLDLTRDPSFGGSVFGSGTYQCGSLVTASSTTNPGYNFVSWTDNLGNVVSTSPNYTFNLNNNERLQANFSMSFCNLTLTRNPSAGGSVSGGGVYQCSTSRTVTATPNVGYEFVNWTNSSGHVVSTSPSYTFNLNNNTTLRANFVVDNCTLTIINSPPFGGSVSPSNSVTQQCGTSVTLTANPSDGYNFDSWTNSLDVFLSSNNPNTFNLFYSMIIYANYNLESYSLTLLKNPVSGGSVLGAGNYNYNQSVTVTAVPDSGYKFKDWTDLSGNVLSTSDNYTFSMPSNNLVLTATFELDAFNVNLISSPLNAGDLTGSGLYSPDDSVTITAEARSDYFFLYWTDSEGNILSRDKEYTFNMPFNNVEYTAVFEDEIECPDDVFYFGVTYPIVKIGNQCWFAENLRTKRFNDGTLIPTEFEETYFNYKPVTGVYDHELVDGINSEQEMEEKYGRMYNWYAASKDYLNNGNNICPVGWKVPEREETIRFAHYVSNGDFLGVSGDVIRYSGADKLKSCDSAIISSSCHTTEHPRWTGLGGTNDFGFNAYPSGILGHITFSSHRLGLESRFWSSTTDDLGFSGHNFLFTNDFENRDRISLSWHLVTSGYSVRCIKDTDYIYPIESSNVTQLSSSTYATCGLFDDDNLKCWGGSYSGVLGAGFDGSHVFSHILFPVNTYNLSNVSKIDSGFSFKCALIDDGTVKCWGSNAWGQIGIGYENYGSPYSVTIPIEVLDLDNATDIALGDVHACVIIDDGTVKCWGRNAFGSIGDDTTINKYTPTSVLNLSNVSQIDAGGFSSCAVLNNGTIKCWGSNSYGKLGDGTTSQRSTPVLVSGISNASQISVGTHHTCALLNDGTVKCWGRNNAGQLGDGTTFNSSLPVSVSGLSNVSKIDSGIDHTCALLNDGTIKCWGRNSPSGLFGEENSVNIFGALGDGTTSNRSVPVSVLGISNAIDISLGAYFSCAILADKSVKCWGDNRTGGLGDGTNISKSSPVNLVYFD